MSDVPHLSAQTLSLLAAGQLSEPERHEAERHLRSCADCAKALPSAGTGESQTLPGVSPRREAGSPLHLPPGELVGRYQVTARLGEGAMGAVYAAFDPRLDRTVALKVLRPDASPLDRLALRETLVREAQALARLSHANVVAVHDVGDLGESVFVAMDYVEGTTLTRWLTAQPRGWREVLRVFQMAGEGLAAAHRAGLAHRDFKPDNVLVGADGVVRVSDFGLARRVDGERTEGAVVGTPAYMSPEQFDGLPADGRSDQFSFCVALWEALYGRRPFDGQSFNALNEQVHAGVLVAPPAGRKVPARVARLLLRGLAAKPADRFASMDVLLAELGRRPGVRRAYATLGTVAGLALLSAGWLGWREVERRRSEPCATLEARATATWGPGQRARLHDAFLATGASYAADSFSLVGKHLDAFMDRWLESARAACTAIDAPDADTRLLALARQACLERQLGWLSATIETLQSADARLVQSSPATLASRRRLVACLHPENLAEPTDPKLRERASGLATELTRAEIELEQGRPADAEARAARVAFEARDAGLRMEEASARQQQASALRRLGRLTDAEAAWEDAVLAAEAGRQDVRALEARLELTRLVGVDRGDVTRARQLLRHVRAAVERLGPEPVAVLAELSLEAALDQAEGHYDDAVEKQRRVLEATRAQDGPAAPEAAEAQHLLASMEQDAQQLDAALADNEASLASFQQTMGSNHPRVIEAWNLRAAILATLNRNEEALEAVSRALALVEASPAVGGAQHEDLLFNVGFTHKRLGRPSVAMGFIDRALELNDQRPDRKVMRASFLSGRAETLQELQRLDEALQSATQALAMREAVHGPTSTKLATDLSVRGGVLESMGRHAEAAADLERALRLLEDPEANPVLRQVTRYELARALWHAPATRHRAIEQARSVRKYFADAGPDFSDYVAEADAWLAAHPPE